MDQSITERPAAQQAALTAAEKLLAHYPSTKALNIAMTNTPAKGDPNDKRYSSQVAAYGYDAAHKTMRIRFAWGLSEYDYHHVPPEKAEAIKTCESFGTWVNQNLKGIYHYECVKARDARA
jgi:hypothetical protein